MNQAASFIRCRSGAVAVEFAIVCLALIMLSVGVVEFGRAISIRNTMSHAIDFAARMLLIDATTSDSDLETAIRDAFVYGDPLLLDIQFSTENTPSGTARQILLQYPLVLRAPGVSGTAITMSLHRRVPLLSP